MGALLHPIEEWARQMIEVELGLSVRQYDDGSLNGMHDLTIAYPDRLFGAVEVTRAMDGSVAALWKLLDRSVDGRWIVPELAGGWTVSLHPTARWKRLRDELPRLLASLEAMRRRSLDTEYDDPSDVHVRCANALGVVRADQNDTSYAGSIYPVVELGSDRSGGVVAPAADAPAEWIGRFLREPQQADVLSKLARSGASSRHAFVVVAGLGEPTFQVFDPLTRTDVQTPTAPPDLPVEVTHVWLTTTWNGGRGLRWDPLAGWLWFDRLQDESR